MSQFESPASHSLYVFCGIDTILNSPMEYETYRIQILKKSRFAIKYWPSGKPDHMTLTNGGENWQMTRGNDVYLSRRAVRAWRGARDELVLSRSLFNYTRTNYSVQSPGHHSSGNLLASHTLVILLLKIIIPFFNISQSSSNW